MAKNVFVNFRGYYGEKIIITKYDSGRYVLQNFNVEHSYVTIGQA